MEVVEEEVVMEEVVEEEAVEVEEVEDLPHHSHHNNHSNNRMWRQPQMSKQWENSQIRLMVIELKRKTSLKKSKDTFALTRM